MTGPGNSRSARFFAQPGHPSHTKTTRSLPRLRLTVSASCDPVQARRPAWTGEDTLTTRDYEQIALQLTGHARAVAYDVRRRADQLPKASGPKGPRRHRPARGGRPAVRDDRGHRALRPEPRPPCPRPLRTAGPPGGRARPGEGCTGRGLNRGLDGCFQLLRQRVECLPGLTQLVADLAQSIFLGVGGLADRSSGGGLARLPPRIPCCSTGCHNGCDAPHRR